MPSQINKVVGNPTVARYLVQDGDSSFLRPDVLIVGTKNTCDTAIGLQTCIYSVQNIGPVDTTAGIRFYIQQYIPGNGDTVTWPLSWGAPTYDPLYNFFDFPSLVLVAGASAYTVTLFLQSSNKSCYASTFGAPTIEAFELTPSPDSNYNNNIGKKQRDYLCMAYLSQKFSTITDLGGSYSLPSSVLHIEPSRNTDNDPASPNTGNYANIAFDFINETAGVVSSGSTANGIGNYTTGSVPYGNNVIKHISTDTAGNMVELYLWTQKVNGATPATTSGYAASGIGIDGDTLSLYGISANYLGVAPDRGEVWVNGVKDVNISDSQALGGFISAVLNDGDVIEIRWWNDSILVVPTAPGVVGYCYRKFTIKKYSEN